MTIDPLLGETPAAAAASPQAATWSTHQLTSFLALVSSAEDERSASQMAVERTAEALEAEVAALVRGREVVASFGFAPDHELERALADVAVDEAVSIVIPGLGACPAFAVGVEDDAAGEHRDRSRPARGLHRRGAPAGARHGTRARPVAATVPGRRGRARPARRGRDPGAAQPAAARVAAGASGAARAPVADPARDRPWRRTRGDLRGDLPRRLRAARRGARRPAADRPGRARDARADRRRRTRRRGAARAAHPARQRPRRARAERGPAGRGRGLSGLRAGAGGLQAARPGVGHGGAGARARAPGRQPRRRLLCRRAALQRHRAGHARRARRPRQPGAVGQPPHRGPARTRRDAHEHPLPGARAELVGHDHRGRPRRSRSATSARRPSARWRRPPRVSREPRWQS